MRNMTNSTLCIDTHIFVRYFIYGLYIRNAIKRMLYIYVTHFPAWIVILGYLLEMQ